MKLTANFQNLRYVMSTLISGPLIKCSVNFHDLNFVYFDSNFSIPNSDILDI